MEKVGIQDMKHWMKRYGWSGWELAGKIDIDYRTLKKILDGEPVSPITAKKVATFYSKELKQVIYPGDIEDLKIIRK